MKNLTGRSKIFLNNILLTIFLSSSTCLASELLINRENGVEHNLNRYLNSEDKVYLHPENIYFLSNKIYISVSGGLIPIQHLACDGNGIFVSIEEVKAGVSRQRTWICKKETCRYENYDGIDYCALCGTYRYAKESE